jgi:hypothetical protein
MNQALIHDSLIEKGTMNVMRHNRRCYEKQMQVTKKSKIRNPQLLVCFLLAPIRLSISAVTNDSKRLNNNADHQSRTIKPGTISDAHFIITMLMKSKNKPSVTMVMGMVSTISIGFKKPLSNASTMARRIAVTLLLMVTPGSKYDTISAATAVTNIFPTNFMVLYNS